MKLKTNFKPLAIFIASATLSACGGGGGGSSPPVVQSNPVPDVVVPLTNF
ncbi:MAG: hypothetical protein PF495_09925 [Spirochaetales bacterium]|jgi:hypothetical protein|nr:hypothetical protein [Spirochaetales bacterium]